MACFYVQDACGDKFCYTIADSSYEPRFRKHAQWWIRYSTRHGSHRDKDANGNPVKQPIKPCKIVVEHD